MECESNFHLINMDTTFDNKKGEKQAQIITAVYVIICLIFLFAIRIKKTPELGNMGVIVNLGTTDSGMNPDNVPTAENVTEVFEEPSQEETVEESTPTNEIESVTQDVEAVDVTASENTSSVSENPVTETVIEETTSQETSEPEQVVDENALFNGNNSSNQGTGNNPGDQGNPNGSLESNIYGDISGSGFGGAGDGPSLKGRVLDFKPNLNNPTNEYGKVVIKITVDKSGKVTKAELVSLYSTNTNKDLVAYAIAESYKFKFNNVSTESAAKDKQVGKIVFNFTAQ